MISELDTNIVMTLLYVLYGIFEMFKTNTTLQSANVSYIFNNCIFGNDLKFNK